METTLKAINKAMPLIFGIGFLAPVIAAAMAALDLAGPFALSQLQFGLLVGAAWGLFATLIGRWI